MTDPTPCQVMQAQLDVLNATLLVQQNQLEVIQQLATDKQDEIIETECQIDLLKNRMKDAHCPDGIPSSSSSSSSMSSWSSGSSMSSMSSGG